MSRKIVNGVLSKPKATSKQPRRGGSGEFVGGGHIHLQAPNARQALNRSYVPFRGKGNKLTTAERVVNAIASSSTDPK